MKGKKKTRSLEQSKFYVIRRDIRFIYPTSSCIIASTHGSTTTSHYIGFETKVSQFSGGSISIHRYTHKLTCKLKLK